MASAFYTYTTKTGYTYTEVEWGTFIIGLVIMLLGPVFLQFGWVIADAIFNIIFDVKIIRNGVCGASLPELPAPLFAGKKKAKSENVVDAYEKLKMYKALCDDEVLTKQEYDQLKKELLNKSVGANKDFESDIDKVKKLKVYVDENVLTEEEFAAEKSKILNK